MVTSGVICGGAQLIIDVSSVFTMAELIFEDNLNAPKCLS